MPLLSFQKLCVTQKLNNFVLLTGSRYHALHISIHTVQMRFLRAIEHTGSATCAQITRNGREPRRSAAFRKFSLCAHRGKMRVKRGDILRHARISESV